MLGVNVSRIAKVRISDRLETGQPIVNMLRGVFQYDPAVQLVPDHEGVVAVTDHPAAVKIAAVLVRHGSLTDLGAGRFRVQWWVTDYEPPLSEEAQEKFVTLNTRVRKQVTGRKR